MADAKRDIRLDLIDEKLALPNGPDGLFIDFYAFSKVFYNQSGRAPTVKDYIINYLNLHPYAKLRASEILPQGTSMASRIFDRLSFDGVISLDENQVQEVLKAIQPAFPPELSFDNYVRYQRQLQNVQGDVKAQQKVIDPLASYAERAGTMNPLDNSPRKQDFTQQIEAITSQVYLALFPNGQLDPEIRQFFAKEGHLSQEEISEIEPKIIAAILGRLAQQCVSLFPAPFQVNTVEYYAYNNWIMTIFQKSINELTKEFNENKSLSEVQKRLADQQGKIQKQLADQQRELKVYLDALAQIPGIEGIKETLSESIRSLAGLAKQVNEQRPDMFYLGGHLNVWAAQGERCFRIAQQAILNAPANIDKSQYSSWWHAPLGVGTVGTLGFGIATTATTGTSTAAASVGSGLTVAGGTLSMTGIGLIVGAAILLIGIIITAIVAYQNSVIREQAAKFNEAIAAVAKQSGDAAEVNKSLQSSLSAHSFNDYGKVSAVANADPSASVNAPLLVDVKSSGRAPTSKYGLN